jgi:uncharacterized YccA/Bax inhibitor family protein
MTLDGTVNRCLISIAVTALSAWWAWNTPAVAAWALPCVLAALGVALLLVFFKKLAPYLTLVYAVAEGVALGAISLMFESRFPGIVMQAVMLTFGTLFALLFAYKSKLIRATENFKLGVAAATGAIFLFILVTLVLGFFGVSTSFMHDASPLSIGISVVFVVVAALNLVLDFDFIESASARGDVPKYMEWYGAFALLVTLVWLYIEVLRLLSKLRSR